jgi:leucyl aminopeptidase
VPLPKLSAVAADAALTAAVPVVLARPAADGPAAALEPGAEAVDEALQGRLADAVRAVGARGAADEVTLVPTLGLAPFPVVAVAGLGKDGTDVSESERVRRAVGAAVRRLADVPAVREVRLFVPAEHAAAAAEGALLGAYRFTTYKSDGARSALRTVRTPAGRGELRRPEIVADAVATVRDLVNTPANDLYPETFAGRARELAEGAGLEVEVLDERALRRGGYGGILGVGGGSARPPRLVRVRYRPTGRAAARARVALVGKGITFDSGGLNLKTANMAWMKSDMGGAAAVIATAVAAARLRLPVEVVATAPMAENMPSGSSYRPSDILTLRSGKRLEVADTDAEGRIILADGLARAAEDDPSAVLEVSTLTGGQLVALGMRTIGAMGEPDLRDRVARAGSAAGESVWPMPLPPDLRPGLDSPVADLANLPGDRWGSMLVAGLFLAEFMPAGVPWVHLDIAGPAFNPGAPRDYTPAGGTGAAVRTLLASLEMLAGD